MSDSLADVVDAFNIDNSTPKSTSVDNTDNKIINYFPPKDETPSPDKVGEGLASVVDAFDIGPVQYSGKALAQGTPNTLGFNPNAAMTPAQYGAGFWDNTVNNIKKAFVDTQTSAILGAERLDAGHLGLNTIFGMKRGPGTIIDAYPDDVKKLQQKFDNNEIDLDEFNKQKEELDKNYKDAKVNYDELDKLYKQKQAASDEYASKINPLYEMKVQNVMNGGDDVSWLDSILYGVPQGLGSMGGLMAPQLAVTFGTKFAAQIAAGLIDAAIGTTATTGETGVGAIAGAILAGGAALATLAYSRKQESYSEVGGTFQSNYEALTAKYMKDHNLTDPSQVPEEINRQNRLKSDKGLDMQFKENMALMMLDIPEAFMTPMSTLGEAFGIGAKLGKISKLYKEGQELYEGVRDYNRWSKVAFGLAKERVRQQMESFEEGFQQAAQYRATDEALGTGDYIHGGFFNSLMNDAYNTTASLDYTLLPGITPAMRANGKYSEDKQFQASSSQGALLAMFTGSLLGSGSLAMDMRAYIKDKNELVQNGLFQDPSDKFRRVHTDALARRFQEGDDAVTRYVHAIKAMTNKTDENGVPYYNQVEADEAIKQVKDTYRDYKDINDTIDKIPKRGFLYMFPTKEQKNMKEMILSNYLHLNDVVRKKQGELATNIQDNSDLLANEASNSPATAPFKNLLAKKIALENLIKNRSKLAEEDKKVDSLRYSDKFFKEELGRVNNSLNEEADNLKTLDIDPNDASMLPSEKLIQNNLSNVLINGYINSYSAQLNNLKSIKSEKDILDYYRANKDNQLNSEYIVDNANKAQQKKDNSKQNEPTNTEPGKQANDNNFDGKDLLKNIEVKRTQSLQGISDQKEIDKINKQHDEDIISAVNNEKITYADAKAAIGDRWDEAYDKVLNQPERVFEQPPASNNMDVDPKLALTLNYPNKALVVPALRDKLKEYGIYDDNYNFNEGFNKDNAKEYLLKKLGKDSFTDEQSKNIDEALTPKEPIRTNVDEEDEETQTPDVDTSDTKLEELPAKQSNEKTISSKNRELSKNSEDNNPQYFGKKLKSSLSIATKMTEDNPKGTTTLGFVEHHWQQLLGTNMVFKPEYQTLTVRLVQDEESNIGNVPDVNSLDLGVGSHMTQDDKILDSLKLGIYLKYGTQEHLVGYVHRLDSVPKLVIDDNIEDEANKIRNYRLNLIKQLKENPDKSFTIQIQNIGLGSLTYQKEFRPVHEAINGDTRPFLGYVGADHNVITNTDKSLMIDSRDDLPSGAIILFIPNEVNGETKYFPSYVKKNKLGEVDESGKSIVDKRILNNVTDNISKWLQNTEKVTQYKDAISKYVFITTDLTKTTNLGEYGIIMPKEKIQGSKVVWIDGKYYRINNSKLEYTESKSSDFITMPGTLQDNLSKVLGEVRGTINKDNLLGPQSEEYMNEIMYSGLFSTNIIQNSVILEQSKRSIAEGGFQGVLDSMQEYQYFTQRTIQFAPIDTIEDTTKNIDKKVEKAKEEEFINTDKEEDLSSTITQQIDDIAIGKMPNTNYEVKSDGVYFEGKKLDNPKNLSHKELITEDIERRRQEEIDSLNGIAANQLLSTLVNSDTVGELLEGSFNGGERVYTPLKSLQGKKIEGTNGYWISFTSDVDDLSRPAKKSEINKLNSELYSEYKKINAKYDAELAALEQKPIKEESNSQDNISFGDELGYDADLSINNSNFEENSDNINTFENTTPKFGCK